ncbi:hypothetical protein [Aurantiacibacter gilvus]|uniref:Uncharacterized protein n=1 Tax=Aurantiacibacter gilvus TaxID=3139141 RepID=A0ABU9IHT4_9SPHN
MATANQAGPHRRGRRLKWLLLPAAVLGAGGWYFRAEIDGFSQAGTGYAAKTACSCRYVGGRALGQCEDDLLPSMWAIWLTEDEAERSVTARIPLIESTTATYDENYGCVLEPWEG